jgi:RNA polymerase sigma factor (sigma-70 family)
MSGQATRHPQTDIRRLRSRTESSNRSMPQAAHSGTLHRTRSRPAPRKTAEAQCDQAPGITGSLRIAYGMFTDFGMEAFAERASIELRATGEHARRRTVDALRQLTPQEAEISRLVAQGSTNREIAAQLFISPSTVEYHLHKAFRKLGVRSRTELARRIA